MTIEGALKKIFLLNYVILSYTIPPMSAPAEVRRAEVPRSLKLIAVKNVHTPDSNLS